MDHSHGKVEPSFKKVTSNNDNLSPPKPLPMHHSNSANNFPESKSHKAPVDLPHKANSHQDIGENLIGDDPFLHKQDLNMDFNINVDEAFGVTQTQPQNIPSQNTKEEVLLNFETVNQSPKNSPPAPSNSNDFDIGGLGGLSGIDFSQDKNKEEEKEKPPNIIKQVKEIHAKEEQDQVEWEEARRAHDNRINMWKGAQVPNSIKTLLCTLHTILWKGAKWEVVGMDKVQNPIQVKKLYRKAILITHPNKVNLAPTEQKFIANRVFSALNEAWKVFETTGQ